MTGSLRPFDGIAGAEAIYNHASARAAGVCQEIKGHVMSFHHVLYAPQGVYR